MTRTTQSPAGRLTARRASSPSAGKILPAHARVHHRSLVLQHLFDSGPHTRSELASLSGLTRPTVTDVVADLLADGLVADLGVRPGTRMGKPATLVGIHAEGAYVVCLDLSGDHAQRGSVVDLAGTTVVSREIAIDAAQGEEAVRLTIELARALLDAAPGRVLGVGVGSPGVVSVDGVVRHAPNLGWTRLDLRARLADALDLPVHVANDADTAALAEDTFGDGSGAGLLLVEIGRGVGAGILLDGHLLRGPFGTAGEIGHVTIVPDGPECSCGRHGCLESYTSAPRLRARIEGLAPDDAAAELAAAGRQLGQTVAPVAQALGLQDIVLSGPDELLDGAFRAAVEQTVLSLTRPFGDEPIRVRMSALGHDGVLAGAAALVLDSELGLS